VNWQNLMNRLAPLRRQWDLAVLANLAAGTERPGDLIEAINAQASDSRRIGWKVLNDTLRRLERSGFVARQEMPGVPRETRYRLRLPAQRLISAVSVLDTWYDDHEPGADTPSASPRRHPAGNQDDSSGADRRLPGRVMKGGIRTPASLAIGGPPLAGSAGGQLPAVGICLVAADGQRNGLLRSSIRRSPTPSGARAPQWPARTQPPAHKNAGPGCWLCLNHQQTLLHRGGVPHPIEIVRAGSSAMHNSATREMMASPA
jgi:DNA-binding HxlR family transcriptional regulator